MLFWGIRAVFKQQCRGLLLASAIHIIPLFTMFPSAVTEVIPSYLLLLSFLIITHVNSPWVSFSKFSFVSKYILSVNMYVRLQVLKESKGTRSPGIRDIGGWEPHSVSAGNWNLVFCKSSMSCSILCHLPRLGSNLKNEFFTNFISSTSSYVLAFFKSPLYLWPDFWMPEVLLYTFYTLFKWKVSVSNPLYFIWNTSLRMKRSWPSHLSLLCETITMLLCIY